MTILREVEPRNQLVAGPAWLARASSYQIQRAVYVLLYRLLPATIPFLVGSSEVKFLLFSSPFQSQGATLLGQDCLFSLQRQLLGPNTTFLCLFFFIRFASFS